MKHKWISTAQSTELFYMCTSLNAKCFSYNRLFLLDVLRYHMVSLGRNGLICNVQLESHAACIDCSSDGVDCKIIKWKSNKYKRVIKEIKTGNCYEEGDKSIILVWGLISNDAQLCAGRTQCTYDQSPWRAHIIEDRVRTEWLRYWIKLELSKLIRG